MFGASGSGLGRLGLQVLSRRNLVRGLGFRGLGVWV